MFRSRLIYWLVAVAIAAVLLDISLRGIDWSQVGRILLRARWGYVAVWIVVGSIALVLRAVRWRVLLQSRTAVRLSTAFWATAAGYFGNNFLPARAGELIRTVMVSAETGLSKSFVLTTAMTERLCDGVTLVLIASVVLFALPNPPGWLAHAARPFAVAGVCGALAVAFSPMLDGLSRRVIAILPVRTEYRNKLLGILEQILTGATALHNMRRLTKFVAVTGVIWLLDAVGVQIGMRALGQNVSLQVALLLITGLGLGSALPATPGYVGIYQFVAVSVLVPFGLSKTDAIAFILLSQALNYVGTAIWGLIAFTRSRVLSLRAAAALVRSDQMSKGQATSVVSN